MMYRMIKTTSLIDEDCGGSGGGVSHEMSEKNGKEAEMPKQRKKLHTEKEGQNADRRGWMTNESNCGDVRRSRTREGGKKKAKKKLFLEFKTKERKQIKARKMFLESRTT